MKTKLEVLKGVLHNASEMIQICEYAGKLLENGSYKKFDEQLDMIIEECEETITLIRKHNLMDMKKKAASNATLSPACLRNTSYKARGTSEAKKENTTLNIQIPSIFERLE